MIVFDVDGTLIGGEETDWRSFDDAFAEATGSPFEKGFFNDLPEVTAKAIVHRALAARPQTERDELEGTIRAGYLKRLRAAHALNQHSFLAANGCAELLSQLRASGLPLAIATGDWRETITFKLTAAGVAFEGIPMATSSDYYSRAEIIAGAVKEAGGSLDDAIYIGDGSWDLRACRQLGIPFVGVGRRHELLLSHGAEHVVRDLTPALFWAALRRLSESHAKRETLRALKAVIARLPESGAF